MSTFETGASDHATNDLILSAMNEGSLYSRHMKLARANAQDSEWMDHIRDFAIPTLRRESRMRHRFTEAQIEEAACIMRERYAEQLCD